MDKLKFQEPPDKSVANSKILYESQINHKKIFEHPSNLILKIGDFHKIEQIYEKNIVNITKFTKKFKGSMLTYQTHGLMIYPAKFIPQIPQFCIQQFSQPKQIILDPFCGCGTTLLEAQLLQRNAYGLDINPIAQLLSKVKTTPLNLNNLNSEYSNFKRFSESYDRKSRKSKTYIQEFPNLSYWFTPYVIQELLSLQDFIFNIEDPAIRDFFRLNLISIIRDVSLADRDQLHPAKTKYSKQKENRNIPTIELFKKSLQSRMPIIRQYSQYDFSETFIQLIGEDATRIFCPTKIDLAITSPPYVNAIDYIRIHKLEAFWAGLLSPKDIASLHRQFVGTENVYKDYYNDLPTFSDDSLNQLIADIAIIDKKRAGIVSMYFQRIFTIFQEVYRLLKPGGHYCIVIGSNDIRGVHVPTPKILIDFAETEIGYNNVINYVYDIINKRLKIPRAQHGGNIKKEWIIVLQKL